MSVRDAGDRRGWALGAGATVAICLVLIGLLANRHSLSASGAVRTPAGADFVVTSTRDAGPGTLRDAILAADRLSTRAHILITAKRISTESALPALINPRGVEVAVATDAGVIDAAHQDTGAVLQISSPSSVITGLTVIHAHGFGIVVNALGVRLESVTITESKVGVLVGTAAGDCTVRTSLLLNDETGLLAEPSSGHLTILSSVFRGNSRAGIWMVASAPAHPRVAPAQERARIDDVLFERNTSGVVVANQPILIQKSRFLANHESALLVLGGVARLEDCEIHESGGTAVSVSAGSGVVLTRNRIFDNVSTAISIRDSEVTITGNTLTHNGLGIVSILTQAQFVPLIADNTVTGTTADALTVIGGAPVLQRNTVTGSRGAAVRQLDLVSGPRRFRATPRLEANVLTGNRIDAPVTGSYTLVGVP
jgi:parallel beta helix pectate lyase-like protein